MTALMSWMNPNGLTSKPAITAIGTANPPYSRPQQDTADFIAAALNLKPSEKRLLKSVYKATGIQQRYSVLKDYEANLGEFTFFQTTMKTLFQQPRHACKFTKITLCSLPSLLLTMLLQLWKILTRAESPI